MTYNTIETGWCYHRKIRPSIWPEDILEQILHDQVFLTVSFLAIAFETTVHLLRRLFGFATVPQLYTVLSDRWSLIIDGLQTGIAYVILGMTYVLKRAQYTSMSRRMKERKMRLQHLEARRTTSRVWSDDLRSQETSTPRSRMLSTVSRRLLLRTYSERGLVLPK